VFAINQTVEYMMHQQKTTKSCCCEMTGMEELTELGERLRPFQPSDLFHPVVHSLCARELNTFSHRHPMLAAFCPVNFPFARHIPIYLSKQVLRV